MPALGKPAKFMQDTTVKEVLDLLWQVQLKAACVKTSDRPTRTKIVTALREVQSALINLPE